MKIYTLINRESDQNISHYLFSTPEKVADGVLALIEKEYVFHDEYTRNVRARPTNELKKVKTLILSLLKDKEFESCTFLYNTYSETPDTSHSIEFDESDEDALTLEHVDEHFQDYFFRIIYSEVDPEPESLINQE